MAAASVHKVLIVDDHPIVRDGLSMLISKHEDLEVCGFADSVDEAIEVLGNISPDVALVDISLKDSNGLDLIRIIKNEYPSVRVLVSSMYDDALYAERALHAGALGYINKQEAARDIVTAIRRVIDGKPYVSDRVSDRILHRMVDGSQISESVESLSDRELEVFRLIGNGLTTAEIAERFNLSVKTIETYRQRIKVKLELRNAAELARRASQWVLESSR